MAEVSFEVHDLPVKEGLLQFLFLTRYIDVVQCRNEFKSNFENLSPLIYGHRDFLFIEMEIILLVSY